MNAIPAKAAGVERLVMVTPTPNGIMNQLVLAAAALAGIDEVWRIGGAQAIAALAFGTERIAPVDVIVGPGNAWVAEAKRQLYGVVGIDMVAGPSEIVVVADGDNDPEWIAADLLSQAEHDPTSQSILFTDDSAFADRTAEAVERQLGRLQTQETARTSWADNGAIILVERLGDAMPLVDRLAPEHLELAVADPDALFAQVQHAGSVFLGRHTPEAVGDYVGGPNHVLPTGRRARFSSGLSVLDFMKRTSFIACEPQSLALIGPAAVTLAHAEGLPGSRPFDCGAPLTAKVNERARSRSTARLAAVQALYQQEMENTPLAKLLDEFHQHRLGQEIEDVRYADAEVSFFDDLVRGVEARRAELDAAITARLSEGWTLDRLDRPMRQILRCGAYELIARIDVPTATVISEYVDVADAFYAKREKGFVNGAA